MYIALSCSSRLLRLDDRLCLLCDDRSSSASLSARTMPHGHLAGPSQSYLDLRAVCEHLTKDLSHHGERASASMPGLPDARSARAVV